MKIKDLRRGQKSPKGDVGIELEMEGANLPFFGEQRREPNTISEHWSIVTDGSLRDGAEYILTRPVETKDVPIALEEMEKMMKDARSKPFYSLRTSSHIHINVNELEYDEVMNYIYLYGLVENIITKMCGRSRLGNRFCLRLSDAEGAIDSICNLIQMRKHGGRRFYDLLNEERMKYAAINVAVLYKYGSLEFRAMEGTNDWPKLLIWISTLLSLRNAAKTYKDIGEIFDDLNKLGAKDFFYKILGKNAEHHWNNVAENELATAASITYDFVLTSQRNVPVAELKDDEEEPDDFGMLRILNDEKHALRAHPYKGGYRFEGTRAQQLPWLFHIVEVRSDAAYGHFYWAAGVAVFEAYHQHIQGAI
jgi:hypothetical protein